MTLTLEERATNFDTMRHIERVRNLLNVIVFDLLKRGELHDQSKMVPPEVSAFTERHNDGNLRKSIEINGPRFAFPPELVEIFENTVELLETPK